MSSAKSPTTDRDRQSTGKSMERVTLRMPKQQVDEVEALVNSGEFPNRSEAIRAAVRELVD